MRIKDVIQTTTNRLGYDIVRYRTPVDYSFDLLEFLIRDELSRDPDFMFIQVGANDGVQYDPLRPSVVRYGLRGLLIEPLPDLFEALVKNYADQPRLMFENCAIADTDGQRRMYRVRPDAPLPHAVHGLASFDRQNLSAARQGVPGLDSYVESVTVPARTLASLVKKHAITHLSLLMIDTEGYDAKIVEAALTAGLHPGLIMYEHVHLSPATRLACMRLLKDHRYHFIEVGMNTYAVADDRVGAQEQSPADIRAVA
jgi:FkbM family methyltransferase